jgi:hypothetical protein
MRNLLLAMMISVALLGCAAEPFWMTPAAVPLCYDNPILVPYAEPNYVFDTVVDVVNDYFKIDHEEPVRLVGTTLIEGRIDTFPKVGATLLEPWDSDSANSYERLESTLQTIRRRAVVKVVPTQGGFLLDVAVFKELENVTQPEHSTAGVAIFHHDTLQPETGVVNPQVNKDINRGWIPQGRDPALEQRILGQLLYRFNLSNGAAVPAAR